MTSVRVLLWLLCALVITKLIDWLVSWRRRKSTPWIWRVEKLK